MKHAVAIALLLTAALMACASGVPDGVIYPSIHPDSAASYDIPVTATFTFEGQPVSITVAVDAGLYTGAAAAEKTVTRFGNARKDDWIEDYFPAFVEEPSQAGFYDALLAELRRVRDERQLDNDRYAELLTVFAQSIAYHTDPDDLEPKFPVETFVDGNGDCDDKTLLLAALLSHEGYDVAVLLFEPEKHVALGIRCEELAYKQTGYAYTETTTQGFIGMIPDSFSGGIELVSDPQVFEIGDGSREYTAGDEVTVILEGRQQAAEEAEVLARQIQTSDTALREMEAELRVRREELDRLRVSNDSGYTDSAITYNALVSQYNKASQQRNELAQRHNTLVDIDRIVVEGFDDRRGTFTAVRSAFS